MARFKVWYRETNQGTVKQGLLHGHSEAMLRHDLDARGWLVLNIEPAASLPIGERLKRLTKTRLQLPRFGVNTSELALLCEVFKALYAAGVQMLQIVEMIIDETPNSWLRKRLVVVLERLRAGDSLAKSMSDPRCQKAFPNLMRQTIHVSESNGTLEAGLGRLAATYKRMAETRQQMISALMYPAFTLIVFFGVCAAIAILIPDALNKFIGPENIKKLEFVLPGSIKLLFTIRRHPAYLIVPPVVVTALGFLWVLGMRYKATRHALTCVQRRIALIGPLLHEIAIVRFLELLSANHESGIAIGDSLALVRDSVGDALIEESLDRIRRDILSSGTSLSASIGQPSEEKVYPGLVRQMVRAGDESGRLAEMLRPIIVFYDNKITSMIKRMLDLVTPIMIVLMGSVVGPVVLGVYKTITLMQEFMVGEMGG